jgi:hypothetical protein
MKIELVDHWWTVLRRSAVSWAAGAWGGVGALIIMIWPVAQWAFDQILPDNPLWRVPFALAVLAITAGSMLFARAVKQPKLAEKLAEKENG